MVSFLVITTPTLPLPKKRQEKETKEIYGNQTEELFTPI